MTDIAKLGFEIDSSPLARAGQQAQKAAEQIGAVGDAADQVGKRTSEANKQLGSLGTGLQRIGSVGGRVAAEIGNLSQAFGIATGSPGGVALNAVLRGATGLVDGLAGSLGRFGPGAAAAASGIGTLATAFLGAQAALASVQDKWAKYEGQLKSTLGSTVAARQAISDLYATAQGTGISFDSTVSVFNRLARNANELGASNSEILQLSSTIQKLSVISGAGAGEISSGMLQLSQALAAGKLNGDELRSIMENMPALAKAIADGLGVSVGQLRAMGAAGELTGDKVFRAILGNAEKVNQQFKDMPDTTEQAFQRVSDAWSRMLAGMGEAANSSGFIRSILNATAGLINLMNGSGSAQMSPEARQMAALQATRDRTAQLPGADREGSDTWRRLQTLDAQIKALQPKIQAQSNEAAAAREAEAYRPAIGLFGRGSTVAKEAKTLGGDQAELSEQIYTIENALIAAGRRGTPSTLPPDQQPTTKQIEQMETALVSLRQKLADTTSALGKFAQGTTDYREALAIGGTGGGLDIVKQAQDIAKQMRSQGLAASTSTTIGSVIEGRAARAGEEVKALERQTDAQKKLAGTVGATRDAVREAEIAQAAYDYRIKTFGTITSPAVEKAVASYTAALRRNKQAQDSLADSRAFQAISDQIEVLQAGAAAASAGAYAMREAEAAARAAQANRQTPGLGDRQLQLFRLQEGRGAAQQIEQLERQAAASRRLGGARSFGEQRQIELEQRIAEAQRNAPKDMKTQLSLARGMRDADQADITKELNAQRLSIEEQLTMQDQQLKLVGQYGEELVVQQAVLQKRAELMRQGVDPDGAGADLVQMAADAARKGYQLDQAQDQANQWRSIWEGSAQGITDSISSAFFAAFDKSQKAGEVLRTSLSRTFQALADDILNVALKPVRDAIMNMVTQQGGSWLSSLFSAGASAGAGAMSGTPSVGAMAANGMAFAGAQAFANGGAFTNSIVSSPTLFRFANGGAVQNGLMGEAGPEAIMPLRRDAGGRLGVSAAGGGGNNISISISVDASGGKQTAARGDDADNRGQQLGEALTRAVREELVQQMRPGGILAKR